MSKFEDKNSSAWFEHESIDKKLILMGAYSSMKKKDVEKILMKIKKYFHDYFF